MKRRAFLSSLTTSVGLLVATFSSPLSRVNAAVLRTSKGYVVYHGCVASNSVHKSLPVYPHELLRPWNWMALCPATGYDNDAWLYSYDTELGHRYASDEIRNALEGARSMAQVYTTRDVGFEDVVDFNHTGLREARLKDGITFKSRVLSLP